MKKIGILSDTHGFLDDRVFEYFADCDEIWHAGDWGSMEVVNSLTQFKPVRGVYGNMDGYDVRAVFPEYNRFLCEEVDVWLTHIGTQQGKYLPAIQSVFIHQPPDLFVCGHSHILKVKYDKKFHFLYVNPGAEGKFGIHKIQTIIRLKIDGKEIKDLEVIEIGEK